jgi:hypothetical protein
MSHAKHSGFNLVSAGGAIGAALGCVVAAIFKIAGDADAKLFWPWQPRRADSREQAARAPI